MKKDNQRIINLLRARKDSNTEHKHELMPKIDSIPSDFLIIDYLLSHLDEKKVMNYFSIMPLESCIKKYIIGDYYFARNNSEDIYPFLEDPKIQLEVWTAYRGRVFRKDINKFINNVSKRNNKSRISTIDVFLNSSTEKYMNHDFSTFHEKILRREEYNLLILCDCLLSLGKEVQSEKVTSEIKGKLNFVKNILSDYKSQKLATTIHHRWGACSHLRCSDHSLLSTRELLTQRIPLVCD